MRDVPILCLRGKTAKGKQRIKQFGNTWALVKTVSLADSQIGKDWYITPFSHNPDAARWIHSTNDPDFEIEAIL